MILIFAVKIEIYFFDQKNLSRHGEPETFFFDSVKPYFYDAIRIPKIGKF